MPSRTPRRLRRAVLAALVAAAWAAPARAGDALRPTAAEAAALKALGGRLPGARLLWTSDGRLYVSEAPDFRALALPAPTGRCTGPRWSPDGRQVLFVREDDGVWQMGPGLAGARRLIAGAHTASWTRDGQAVTCIADDGYRVLRRDLGSGKTAVIYDARKKPWNGRQVSQAAELHPDGRHLLIFRREPGHATEIADLTGGRYIANASMLRGDCGPAWSPDGSYLVLTARTSSRPVLRADFDAKTGRVSPSRHFVGLGGHTKSRYYIHGERVSNDGEWLAFGGVIFGGPQQSGRREIYLWRIGTPEAQAVRVTFNTGEDAEPDLFIPPEEEPAPAAATGPATTGPATTAPAGGAADSITVLSPNGGETLKAGATHVIRFRTVNIDDVTISLSTDGGQRWKTFVFSLDTTSEHWGRYPWKVPETPSDNCLIEVRGYFGHAPDESDRPFRIVK